MSHHPLFSARSTTKIKKCLEKPSALLVDELAPLSSGLLLQTADGVSRFNRIPDTIHTAAARGSDAFVPLGANGSPFLCGDDGETHQDLANAPRGCINDFELHAEGSEQLVSDVRDPPCKR